MSRAVVPPWRALVGIAFRVLGWTIAIAVLIGLLVEQGQ